MTETPAKASAAEKESNKPLPANAPKPPGDIRRRAPKPTRKGPFVKYVGDASHRKITPAQWKTLGIGLHDDVATHTWSVANDKMIESSEFSDEQLDYLLIDDRKAGSNTHAFLEVDYNESGQLVQVVPE
jgi:hypothetical protein